MIYDAIIIGAGHNGLTAAAYLAKAGRRVLVLERREVVGGAAVTEEPYPGFKFDSLLGSAAGLRPRIVRDLDLRRHGLSFVGGESAAAALLPDGEQLCLSPDVGATAESIRRFSESDAERWPSFSAMLIKLAGFLDRVYWAAPPRLTESDPADLATMLALGLRLKGLGREAMIEMLRTLPMPVAELLNDWFESDALKGAVGAGGVHGLFQGPRASGTALMLLHHLAGARQAFRSAAQVRGGVGSVSAALASAAVRHGAQIRTGAEAAQVIVRHGRAVGVALKSGEELSARLVASAADPRRTFLGLIDPQYLDPEFLKRVRHIKMRGASAKVNLALDALPPFASGFGGGAMVIAPSLDYLERAYDEAKYGGFSRRPYLEITIPSAADPGLAPPGKHVMSIHAQYAPYHLKEGDWQSQREKFGDAVIDALAEYWPGVKNAVLHRQVLTPLDLEETYGLTEGSLYHGELMLDQFFFIRPVAGWAQYRTPIDGLYLCGAGAHPGGGVSGLPGYHAARQMLKDGTLGFLKSLKV